MNDFFDKGVVAINSGDLLEGVSCFEKAAQQSPRDAEVIAYLGQSLIWLGKRKEGLDNLHRAGNILSRKAKKNKDVNDLIALSQQLQECNDFDGSIKLMQQAVQINRKDARIFQLLAIAYSRLNANDLAIIAINRALIYAPESLRLKILRATIEFRRGNKEKAKAGLEVVLDASDLLAEDAWQAHKELSFMLDRLGEFKSVFKHLNLSADLAENLADVRAQDGLLLPKLLESYQTEFDSSLLSEYADNQFDHDCSAPVFIVGFLRSGTTLVQEVLSAHPNVFVADEAEFIMGVRSELARMFPDVETVAEQLRKIDKEGLKHLRQYYWQLVKNYYGKSIKEPVFVDKTTMNTIDMGLINCIFPDAKVIFVLRDPRDVCLSCFMQTMTVTPVTVNLLSWQGTINFYVQVMEWWLYIRKNMVVDYREVRYEDAVLSFEDTFKEVFEFIGLYWVPEVEKFHLGAAKKFIASPSFHQVTQPLYRSSLSRWQNYTAQFEEAPKEFQSLIKVLGYGKDSCSSY